MGAARWPKKERSSICQKLRSARTLTRRSQLSPIQRTFHSQSRPLHHMGVGTEQFAIRQAELFLLEGDEDSSPRLSFDFEAENIPLRRFRGAIGVTPKSAARVFRFERACRLIKDERPSLAHVAASCGYFDQSHMTREWNALAGCSPRTWIASELPFLQDYEIGGSYDGRDECESTYRSFV